MGGSLRRHGRLGRLGTRGRLGRRGGLARLGRLAGLGIGKLIQSNERNTALWLIAYMSLRGRGFEGIEGWLAAKNLESILHPIYLLVRFCIKIVFGRSTDGPLLHEK